MNLIKNIPLFGFHVMSTKIDSKSYNKKSIVSVIEKNFKLNKTRNKWDKTSVLDHAYKDFDNPKYHKVNFDTLIPVYEEVLRAMFDRMGLLSTFSFEFRIVNYTCMSKSHYMNSHLHPGVDFTAVHYIQFDKKHHTPTMFEITSPHVDYLHQLRPRLADVLSSKHSLNSWAYRDWLLDVEEDDFCFSPSFLKHRIDSRTSKNKNRITLVLNTVVK